MVKILFYSLALFGMIACGAQRQLQKAFSGKSVSALHQKFGEPETIINNGKQNIYIFEKEKELESTEINQGKLTLDPIVTPKVIKTEKYYFTVENGIVEKARYEEVYERRP